MGRRVYGGHAKWQAVIFAILIATADAGFQELRETALRGDAGRRIEAAAGDAEAHDAEVAKAVRAVEQAQQVAKQAVQNAVRHNRRGSSFAETALSADSKALAVADSEAEAGVEPISAGIIVVMTITSMILKVVNAAHKARLEMLQGKYTEQVQLIVDETSEAVKAMTRNYEETFGEVSRQIGDLVREVGVTTVNWVPDEVLKPAAEKAIGKHNTAKTTAAPAKSNPPTPTENVLEELHARYINSPAIDELKLKLDAFNSDTKPETTGNLRKALAKVVAADYAVLHSMGNIRDAGKGALDKSALKSAMDKYVFAVDPTEFKKLFKLAATTSTTLTSLLPEEKAVEAAMRRMSINSMGHAFAGTDVDNQRAAQRDANLALLESKGTFTMQLPETESRWDAVSELKEYADGLVDVSENLSKLTQGIMTAMNGGTLAEGVSSQFELAESVISGVHAAVAIIGAVANTITAVKLHRVGQITDLEFARDSGIFSERHQHAIRRGLATTCRLFDSLRVPLTNVISTSIVQVALSDTQAAKKPNFVRPDFSSALGLTNLLDLKSAAKRRISVTMATRFCGIFQPMLARIEELFEKRGECAFELDNSQKPNQQVTGAPDVKPGAAVVPTTADLLGWTTGSAPQLTGADLTFPRVETCLPEDIYDIQIAKSSDVADVLKNTLGFTLMKDIDNGWVAPGDHYLKFEGDINRKLKKPSKAGDVAEAPKGRFTEVYVLTCQALHDKGAAACKASAASHECVYFRALRFPVTDVTFAYKLETDTDATLPQLKLHKAGYQMLYLNGDPKLLVQNLKSDIDNTGKPVGVPTKQKVTDNDVRRGASDDKPVVTMHILRGGMTPLQDIRLAPFVSKSVAVSKQTFPADGDAASLTQPFCVQNSKYTRDKLNNVGSTMPTRWYMPKDLPKDVPTATISGAALSMVVPPECKEPVDITTIIDETWMKKNLWQQIRGKEGKEADVKIIKHTFDTRCPLDANKATWERIPASPFVGGKSNEAITQKPYIWVKRRFAMPAFGTSTSASTTGSTKPQKVVPTCPWECSDQLKGIIMPPAPLYASQKALAEMRGTSFKLGEEFEMVVKTTP